MFTKDQVKELGKERGYDHAAFADAYEGGFWEESDIPDDSSIEIPYYAEAFPDDYREAFQDGCREFIESQREDDETETETSWVYADDPRDR